MENEPLYLSHSSEPVESEIIHRLVKQIMLVEDTTSGDAKQGYLYRFRGRILLSDTSLAYQQLEEKLKPYGYIPVFRLEDNRQVIKIVPALKTSPSASPKMNLILFVLTLFSVILTGGLNTTEPLPSGILPSVLAIAERGWPFTAALLSILAAHEFGHYCMGKYHKVDVSLPYFIPLPPPFGLFGTMGAFINIRSHPRNRRQLFDIGIAGPLAGLAVTLPVLFIGMKLSSLAVITPSVPPSVGIMEGNSILYLLIKYLRFGTLLPAPVHFGTDSIWLYWLKYFFTGQPVPLGGVDVILHPVAWAGWIGLLVTMSNLIPAGQLDGGHISNTVLGPTWSRRLLYGMLLGLAVLGLAWSGWWLWAMFIYFIARNPAQPLDTITPLDLKRKILGGFMIILFFLIFIPVPLTMY